MKLKRILCLAIIPSVLLSLAACGGSQKDSRTEPAQAEQTGAISADGQWLGEGGCYKLDRLREGDYYLVKGSPEHPISLCGRFDRLYDGDGALLYDGYIRDYAVAEDGIWCVRETGMVDGKYNMDCYAVKLGFDGQELARFDVSVGADSLAVSSGAVYIYDAMDKQLAVYGADGAELGRVDLGGAQLEDFSGRLYTGGDGGVWLLSDVQSGLLLYPVDLSAMSLGPVCALPADMLTVSTGTAEHPFLLATDKELTYFDPASGAASNILYWEECGISGSELSSFIPDGDGFLCISVTGLSRLRPAQPEEIHPRTRLTLGTVVPYDSSAQLAALFSAVSDYYFVEVIDYSDGGELSIENAQMKLNTELLSGDGPDMVMLFDMGSLQSASAFADMYPLLDVDAELSRDDFYGLRAFETSGRLLLAPSHLYISTFGALPEVAKDRTGWTWDEYFALKSKLPPDGVMASYLSADFFLSNSLELYAPHAIDWTNGTCSFDTPDFVRILEAAKEGYDPDCPVENPYFIDEVNAMMADGRMILEGIGFSDVESFAQNERLSTRELNYIGWPTPDGSCGSVFHVSGVAINAASDCMEGCWEFAKYVLKSTYAYKPTFERAIAEATAPGAADGPEQRSTLTQAQAERYRKLLESITVAVSDSSEINEIVLNEAAAMFAGDRTPAETAKLIQSKLSIYVAEHR